MFADGVVAVTSIDALFIAVFRAFRTFSFEPLRLKERLEASPAAKAAEAVTEADIPAASIIVNVSPEAGALDKTIEAVATTFVASHSSTKELTSTSRSSDPVTKADVNLESWLPE